MKRASIRKRLAAALVVSTAVAAFTVQSQATPLDSTGSPLVGSFCSAGAAITGQGATFAKNAHTTVFIPEYSARCGAGSFAYTSNGSGAGIRAAINHVPDFAGSDDPMALNQWAQAVADAGANPQGRVSPLHHVPIAVGAITVPANLTSCGIGQEQLKLRSQMIGSIFSGVITNWNHQALVVDNPALASCNKPIKVVVRSDGSGTTFAFKDYLSKRNPQFQVYKQAELNTTWPAETVGVSITKCNGNGGVANCVGAIDGAIGYVELSTAKNSGLKWALVDGPHAQFVSADAGTAANCVGAAQAAVTPPTTLSPSWDAVSITDSPDPTTYPICTMTYALIFNNLRQAFGSNYSKARAQTLVDYLNVALRDTSQALLPTKGYARLPLNIQLLAQAGLASIVY